MTEQFFLEKTKWLSLHICARFQTTTFIHACKLFILLCIKTAFQIFTPINQGQWQRSQTKKTKKKQASILHICVSNWKKKNNTQMLHILQTTTISFFWRGRGGSMNPIHVYALSKNQLNTKEDKGIIWSAPSGR